jgi:hypothetical protein
MGKNNTEINVQIFKNNTKYKAKMETIYIKNIAKSDKIYYGIKLLKQFGLRPK